MDTNSFQFQALITFLVPFFMQLAKRSQAPALNWIDANKPKICVITGIFTALATSTGIEFTHAAHSLTVTWPDGATIARGFVTFFVATIIQIAGQHALYDGFWKHLVPTPKAEMLWNPLISPPKVRGQ
jgi:hypothetical protein